MKFINNFVYYNIWGWQVLTGNERIKFSREITLKN